MVNLSQLLRAGVEFHTDGRLDKAKTIYEQIIQVSPRNSSALHLLGVIACQQKEYEKGVGLIGKALTIGPQVPAYYNSRGNALLALRRFNEAIDDYDKAIALRPDYADAHNNRGNAVLELGKFEEAIRHYDRAIELKAGYADAYNNRGNALLKLGRFLEAIKSYDSAVELRPNLAEAHFNRGNAFLKLRQFGEAIRAYDEAVALKSDYAEAHNNRGGALKELERFEEAIGAYEMAIAAQPNYAEAYSNKAQTLLLMERFEDGFAEYEWRNRTKAASGNRNFEQPLLRSLDGVATKAVLVHYEQGLGDTIQFCRYVGLLKDRGARVLFAPQTGLRTLLRSLDEQIEMVDLQDQSLVFDYRIPLMSLPFLFRTSRETIPGCTPYLHADTKRIQKWKERIGTHGYKIGICWKGNSTYGSDAVRSPSLDHFASISRIPRVRLISLHKGDGEKQLATLPEGMAVEVLGPDFDSGPDAFVDTAAAMKCLDLVITSDTAVAHLAGALAVPTWIALRNIPDWRWMLERTDSPWYPTARLFRQNADGDWTGVFERIEASLTGQLAMASEAIATPTVRISWGDLIDKVTILEIKSRRLKSPAALANVKRELQALSLAAQSAFKSSSQIKAEAGRLLQVNQLLWDLEDQIRKCEASKVFDDQFIELARSIYKTNDERASIKRSINRLLSSELVEEKSYEEY